MNGSLKKGLFEKRNCGGLLLPAAGWFLRLRHLPESFLPCAA
jgi:nitrogen fixation protein